MIRLNITFILTHTPTQVCVSLFLSPPPLLCLPLSLALFCLLPVESLISLFPSLYFTSCPHPHPPPQHCFLVVLLFS